MASGLGFGVDLLRNGVSIFEVVDLGGPSLSRDAVEKTHHKSPNRWREFIKGLKDGGEISITIQYDPQNATHAYSAGLLADFANDTSNPTYSVVFPDGTTWTLPGFVTGFEPAPELDDMFTADVTIKVAGQPTLV